MGSGRGYLQDLVDDYTGLDLSPSVARHYHKKFVVGSATALPFPDNTLDAIWTVWGLEHIPEPEKTIREMRRVLKPRGKLFLMAAWNCKPRLADGFAVRPHSDFNWKGKLVKGSLLLRDTAHLQTTYLLPTRFLRHLHYRWSGGATPLHCNKLAPNYAVYWQPDSEAAIDIDGYEAYLWHSAQGDQCLNCGGPWQEMTQATGALILQVNK
ncbi:MAG: class I SAM-dependent methyltransferase [Acidobacteriaceae bacterium]|nr:class I SAM-dependent methyltransferase [Acidobacteriaceae bacterium]